MSLCPLTVGEIESFPPNANVFKEDAYHMGQRFGKGWWLMFDHSDESVFKYVILVHEPSGRRFKLQVPESLQDTPDPECEKCNGDGYIVEDVEVCPESGSAVGSCVECDCTWETIWKFPYQRNEGLDWNSNVNIKEKHREHPSVRHRNQRH